MEVRFRNVHPTARPALPISKLELNSLLPLRGGWKSGESGNSPAILAKYGYAASRVPISGPRSGTSRSDTMNSFLRSSSARFRSCS